MSGSRVVICQLKGMPAYRDRFAALCRKLGLKRSFVLEDAIHEYMERRNLTIRPARLSGRRDEDRRISKAKRKAGRP